MLKLSELTSDNPLLAAALEPQASPLRVIVDVDDVVPDPGLRHIILIADLQDGSLAEDFLDVAINYTLSGVNVTIEVPSSSELDLEGVAATAAAIKASLAVTFDSAQNDFDTYLELMEPLSRSYFKHSNIIQNVFPVSDFVRFLFVELMDPKEAAKADKRQVLRLSLHDMELSDEQIERLCERLRRVIYDLFDGRANYEIECAALLAGIGNLAEEQLSILRQKTYVAEQA